MFRTVALVGLALATIGGATAGTVVPIDLATTPHVFAGSCTYTSSPCTPTLSTTNVNGTWENAIFSSTYNSVSGLPSPSSMATNTSNPASTPFILDEQSASPNYDEYESTNTADTNSVTAISIDLGTCSGRQMTSSCGVSNVDDIYTMLQGIGDTFGNQGIMVYVTGETSNGTAVKDTIDLTAGIDYRDTSSNGTVTCDEANAGTATLGTNCTGQASDTGQTSGVDSSPGGNLPGATVTVFNNAFGTLSQTVTNVDPNYYWDVQEISLGGVFVNGYLDSITIEGVTSSTTANELVLNGLSLDQTPEPGTFVMFGIGLVLAGAWRVRANRSKSATTE